MGGVNTLGSLGIYLRELRRSCGQSLAGVAARAGVSERSLSRWENGAAGPRARELELALRALGASPAERARARALAGATRARVLQQREAAAGAAALLGRQMIPPGPGTLLRALRHRCGHSLAETAARLDIQPSSVSRWERSEMLPDPARLEAVFDCLEARFEERAALRGALAGGGALAGCPLEEEPAGLEALRGEFHRLASTAMWQEPAGPMDLCFVSLEARLWSGALEGTSEGAAARCLLGQVCAYHAFWLSNARRLAEAAPLAWRTRRLCEPDGPGCYAYLIATIISARWAAAGGVKSRGRARRCLQSNLPWKRHPELHAWAMSELGGCLLLDRDPESGLRIAAQGWALARTYDRGEAWHRRLAMVALLLRAGRPGAALDWLVVEPGVAETPGQSVREGLLWVEAHQAAGHPGEAQDHLRRVSALVRDHGLDIFRPEVDRWAARL
jgi:transcriptional regulator with XRE-family HTH domain